MEQFQYDLVNHNNFLGSENVGGVTVYPTPITLGQSINVIYNGLLNNSGAAGVYLHMGFGPHQKWHNISDLKMFKTGRGWEQTVEINDHHRLNFCFKDCANNWDNNSGHNWSFEVHDGNSY